MQLSRWHNPNWVWIECKYNAIWVKIVCNWIAIGVQLDGYRSAKWSANGVPIECTLSATRVRVGCRQSGMECKWSVIGVWMECNWNSSGVQKGCIGVHWSANLVWIQCKYSAVVPTISTSAAKCPSNVRVHKCPPDFHQSAAKCPPPKCTPDYIGATQCPTN